MQIKQWLSLWYLFLAHCDYLLIFQPIIALKLRVQNCVVIERRKIPWQLHSCLQKMPLNIVLFNLFGISFNNKKLCLSYVFDCFEIRSKFFLLYKNQIYWWIIIFYPRLIFKNSLSLKVSKTYGLENVPVGKIYTSKNVPTK